MCRFSEIFVVTFMQLSRVLALCVMKKSVLLASYSKAIAKVNNKFILGAPAFILVFVDAKIQDGTVHFNS